MTSHNPYIAHLLNHSSVQTRFSSMVTDINSNFTEDEKNLTRIFKAIHTGDVRLVAYFLGLDGFPTNGFESLFQVCTRVHFYQILNVQLVNEVVAIDFKKCLR